jgi:predicted nucleotidyltransferase
MDLKFYLEELLSRPVDLVLKGSLKPALRERILREVRDVA